MLNLPKNYYPLTPEAAITVASDLLFADKREAMEGHGHDNVMSIVMSALMAENSCYWKSPNGKIAAIGGTETDGKIWMLCTPAVKEYPLQFAKDKLRYVNSRPNKLIGNIVDKRNKSHIKLLRFLGFKFLREITFGPNNLPFLEFCKIPCAYQATKETVTTTEKQEEIHSSQDYSQEERNS